MDRHSQTPPDYRDASAESALADTRAAIAHTGPLSSLITPTVTPRFAPSCSDTLLRGLGQLAQSDGGPLPIQTHLAESRGELELVRELFPDAASYTAVYDGYGLLTERTVLAHCIHISDEEVRLIRARNAGVSHCPTSNMALGSGTAKVRRLLDEGVKVGLGTDVSAGWAMGMLGVCRAAIGCSALLAEGGETRARLSESEVLFLATRGGAQVMGLAEKGVGVFKVGGVWDAQLVELGLEVGDGEEDDNAWGSGAVDVWETQSWEEKIGKWIWGGDERNTVRVWVAGREVWRRPDVRSSVPLHER